MSFQQSWNHWWFRTCPPHALAIVRIVFGIFLFIYALTYVPFTEMIHSNQGLVMPLYADVSTIFQAPSLGIAYVIAAVLLISIVLFTLGIGFKVATLLLILLGFYYWQLQLYLFPASYNRIFWFLLIILFFSGADKTFSLSMKWKHGSWLAWEPISILPQRLIALQISATYLGVGWQKIILKSWQGGEVLLYSLMGMWGTKLATWFTGLGLPMWFYTLQVQLITLFELFLPFGLWYKKSRLWFMAGGVLFHLLISLFLAIWWFVALYPLYLLFFEPEEVQRWVRFSGSGSKSANDHRTRIPNPNP